MSDQFELIAEERTDLGKGASRRLRRFDWPRTRYYLWRRQDPPVTHFWISKDLEKSLENEAFYSHVLTSRSGEVKEKAILKDLQRHPAKNRIMHADFMRIDDQRGHQGSRTDYTSSTKTPAPGVKMEGAA